jgi:PHD/YefM family antitoxin component YafN of YafNO toxin-antitoxin module
MIQSFSGDFAMFTISANDLKTKGITAIEQALADQNEAVVSVRGKDRFVVMDLAHYHHLRECELEAALAQARAEVAAGQAVNESAEAHLARLDAMS